MKRWGQPNLSAIQPVSIKNSLVKLIKFRPGRPHLPRTVKGWIVLILFIAFLSTLGGFAYILRDLPSPERLSATDTFAVSTKIYDRNGTLLYEIYGDENRTPIKLADLPPYVSQASIAIEDQHFYKHFGFDVEGVLRATRNTVFQQKLQGGSTITQQLVKTALLSRERTVKRKIKEAALTIATEARYSKDEILEMYLNHIPYGGTSWGIEAAAQTYFGKSAKDVTIGEAALLAGLPQSPTRYSPFSNPDLAKQRQRDVLRRMAEEGFITQEQADTISKEELKYASPKIDIKAPHFVMYVRDQLVDMYGEDTVERGGLRVTTTLDLGLQEVAQASLSAEIAKLQKHKVGNGAALVTKPNTGEILAMIGSKDYFDASSDGQVNITTRERQPGSSIKPLNVVTAFQYKILTPGSMLLDIPTCFKSYGQALYCPRNYDGSFHGPVQTRFFLGNSYNIPQVKILAMVELERFIQTAKAMGITTWKDPSNYGLSLSLGGGEVKMVDMAVAYGTIANQGLKVPLHPITKVETYWGEVLYEYKPQDTKETVAMLTDMTGLTEANGIQRVLDREPAYLVSHILLDNSARVGAFGSKSELVIPNQVVSAKTGTTNDLKDNWTVGFTPEFVTIVWVGNNDNKPMNRSLVSGITGAAPIWNDIMSYTLKDQKPLWPDKPKDVIDKSICTSNGLLPSSAPPQDGQPAPEGACQTRNEFFWKGTEPTSSGVTVRDIWINPQTGLPPKQDEPTDGLAMEKRILLSDAFTKDYCLDCVRPVDDKGKTQYERYVVDLQSFYADREQPLLVTPGESPDAAGENLAPGDMTTPVTDPASPQPTEQGSATPASPGSE